MSFALHKGGTHSLTSEPFLVNCYFLPILKRFRLYVVHTHTHACTHAHAHTHTHTHTHTHLTDVTEYGHYIGLHLTNLLLHIHTHTHQTKDLITLPTFTLATHTSSAALFSSKCSRNSEKIDNIRCHVRCHIYMHVASFTGKVCMSSA